MTSRVLVADDSLTIQKVIGITLANSGYDLSESLNETDLFKKIQNTQYDLILLDFNLSDTHSGYELSKQINQQNPNALIVVMLGTFDTVDDSQFESCGISDKIVKPFESTKFIKRCRDLLEGERSAPISSLKNSDEIEKYSKADDLDQWRVDGPQVLSLEDPKDSEDEIGFDQEKERNLDPLASEIEGWGFGAHSLEEKFQKAFPPLIEDSPTRVDILSKFQAVSDFVQSHEDDAESELEDTQPSFHVPVNLKEDLLSAINDDISAEAFWAVDEVVPKKSEEESFIVNTHLNEVTSDLTEKVQAFKADDVPLDLDEIVNKLKVTLRPMIEEMVKDFCRQKAEKVAWEVIPDLAENLIRKEIKEISESIKH